MMSCEEEEEFARYLIIKRARAASTMDLSPHDENSDSDEGFNEFLRIVNSDTIPIKGTSRNGSKKVKTPAENGQFEDMEIPTTAAMF
mmetsp:Transcript_39084/g.70421  ORF Transcript_39084/g.70421 Transcript_39084/m.70421 type:complete len:87 (+) Transcript_39084:2-262(+)